MSEPIWDGQLPKEQTRRFQAHWEDMTGPLYGGAKRGGRIQGDFWGARTTLEMAQKDLQRLVATNDTLIFGWVEESMWQDGEWCHVRDHNGIPALI